MTDLEDLRSRMLLYEKNHPRKKKINKIKEAFEPVEVNGIDLSGDNNFVGTDLEITPSSPVTNEDNGIAQLISDLIKDEWEAIDGYNSAIATIASLESSHEEIISVLRDIVNEENIHIGQLEAVLKTVSDNAESIQTGKAEGEQQLGKEDSHAFHDRELEDCTITA